VSSKLDFFFCESLVVGGEVHSLRVLVVYFLDEPVRSTYFQLGCWCSPQLSVKGYRFPKCVISYAVYLYHRFSALVPDVQALFEAGASTSTTRRFIVLVYEVRGLSSQALRHVMKRGWAWRLDEMRVVVLNSTLVVAGSGERRRCDAFKST